MLDIKYIRENVKIVKETVKNKGIDLNIDDLLELDEKRINLLKRKEVINHNRKNAAKGGKGFNEDMKEAARSLKEDLKEVNEDYDIVEKKYKDLLLLTPQIPQKDTPIGKSEEQNVEIKKQGKLPKFDFKIKDHVELGKALDIIDFEKGVKVHGFRGYFLKNEGARLQMALMMYAINRMVQKGFVFMLNPVLVKEMALVGSGHFPFGKEEVFQVANPGKLETGENVKDPLYLGGTAEPALLAMYAKEVIKKEDLPIKVCGFSTCFRSEVGSYGKDTKGLYRVHEFMKVEQVVICENDYKVSENFFDEIKGISEEILQELELPYRIIQTCTGDMGAGKYRMDDIETWMPARENYGETHSCSNIGDWQARRLNIKFDDKGKKELCHTLNNTVLAGPRILIPLLENNQQKDGSVKIPKVLWPYMAGTKVIKIKK